MKDLKAIDPKASKLRRQEPGKMGLGTSEQEMRPPGGWKPPKKPDLMTSNVKGRRSRD